MIFVSGKAISMCHDDVVCNAVVNFFLSVGFPGFNFNFIDNAFSVLTKRSFGISCAFTGVQMG